MRSWRDLVEAVVFAFLRGCWDCCAPGAEVVVVAAVRLSLVADIVKVKVGFPSQWRTGAMLRMPPLLEDSFSAMMATDILGTTLTPRITKIEGSAGDDRLGKDDLVYLSISLSENGASEFVSECERINEVVVKYVFDAQTAENPKRIEFIRERLFPVANKFGDEVVLRAKLIGLKPLTLPTACCMRMTFTKTVWIAPGGKFGIHIFVEFNEDDIPIELLSGPPVEDDDEEYCCPITLTPPVHPVTTECGHTFERSALERYRIELLYRSRAAACPLCRHVMANAHKFAFGLKVKTCTITHFFKKIKDACAAAAAYWWRAATAGARR